MSSINTTVTSNIDDIIYRFKNDDVNDNENILKVIIDKLTKDNQELKVTNDNLTKDKQELKVTNDNLTKDKQELKVTNYNLTKDKQYKDDTITRLNNIESKDKLEISLLRTKNNNLKDKDVTSKQEINRLKLKVNRLLIKNKESEIELEYSKTQYNELYKSVRPSTMDKQEIINIYKVDEKTYTIRKGQRAYIETFGINVNDPNQVMSLIVKNAKITSTKIRAGLNRKLIAACKNIHIKLTNNNVYTNSEFKQIITGIINN